MPGMRLGDPPRGRYATSGVGTRANHVTTVNMATGEILGVAQGHSMREVKRLVRAAERRRARHLRAGAITSWRLARVS